jgi:hypothetical protein
METPSEIKHHKEVHSFYMFVAIISFTIVVLQPISMLLAMIVNVFQN